MAIIDPTLIYSFNKQFPYLTEKESHRVLLHYLGFNDGQIGEMLGVTRQSIQKFLDSAQYKLKAPNRKALINCINAYLFLFVALRWGQE
ncbi:hypothetical protein [Escherichia coli]|uniref:hypothetical protein n=1 Tax=Escherichia coli TaxID=562 RepID=UPI00158C5CA7|nr:hypothetical protein [Escherichia coli]